MSPERRAYLLRSTALRRPDFYRVVVDGALLTPQQRVALAIRDMQARVGIAHAAGSNLPEPLA